MSTYPVLFFTGGVDEFGARPIVIRVHRGVGYWADADRGDVGRGASVARCAEGAEWRVYGPAVGIDDLEDQFFDDGWSGDPGPAWVVVRK